MSEAQASRGPTPRVLTDTEVKAATATWASIEAAFRSLQGGIGDSREMALARTNLEQAGLWLGAHIARHTP